MRSHRNTWLVILGVVVAVLAAGCLPTEDWGQFGFNERHTGFPSQETAITSTNVSSLAVRWTLPSDGSRALPLVAGGRLFTFGDTVRTYSTLTHNLLWERNVAANSAAVVNGQLFVLSSSNSFPTTQPAVETILDVTDGHVVTTYSFPNGNAASGLVALNGVVWFVLAQQGVPTAVYRQVGSAAPAVLFADAKTSLTADWGTMVQYNGLLEVIGFASDQPVVVAINSTTGKRVWTSVLPKGPSGNLWGPFRISAGYDNVYVTGVQGVAALSASSGKLRWTQTSTLCGKSCATTMPDEVVYGRVALADNRVYVSAWGGVFALKPSSGEVIWRFGTHANADASPSVANGIVYTFDGDGNLVALTESGGKLLKRVNGWFTAYDPIVYNGQLFVNDGATGALEALGVS